MLPHCLLCPDVIQEIAEFIAERDGHPAQADRIYLTNGASEGKGGLSLALPSIAAALRVFIFFVVHISPPACRITLLT